MCIREETKCVGMFVTLEVIREISTFSQVGLTRLVKMSTGHFFCLILSHGNL